MNPFKWLVCWWHGRHVPISVQHPVLEAAEIRGGYYRVCCRCGVECR